MILLKDINAKHLFLIIILLILIQFGFAAKTCEVWCYGGGTPLLGQIEQCEITVRNDGAALPLSDYLNYNFSWSFSELSDCTYPLNATYKHDIKCGGEWGFQTVGPKGELDATATSKIDGSVIDCAGKNITVIPVGALTCDISGGISQINVYKNETMNADIWIERGGMLIPSEEMDDYDYSWSFPSISSCTYPVDLTYKNDIRCTFMTSGSKGDLDATIRNKNTGVVTDCSSATVTVYDLPTVATCSVTPSIATVNFSIPNSVTYTVNFSGFTAPVNNNLITCGGGATLGLPHTFCLGSSGSCVYTCENYKERGTVVSSIGLAASGYTFFCQNSVEVTGPMPSCTMTASTPKVVDKTETVNFVVDHTNFTSTPTAIVDSCGGGTVVGTPSCDAFNCYFSCRNYRNNGVWTVGSTVSSSTDPNASCSVPLTVDIPGPSCTLTREDAVHNAVNSSSQTVTYKVTFNNFEEKVNAVTPECGDGGILVEAVSAGCVNNTVGSCTFKCANYNQEGPFIAKATLVGDQTISCQKAMVYSKNFITVEMNTDKGRYAIGDDLKIRLKVSETFSGATNYDADFNLFLTDEMGKVIQLCPNGPLAGPCTNWDLSTTPFDEEWTYDTAALSKGIYSLSFKTTSTFPGETVISDNSSQITILVSNEVLEAPVVPDNNFIVVLLLVALVAGIISFKRNKN